MDRRDFIFYGAGGTGALCAGFLGGHLLSGFLHSKEPLLRPPGALEETEFLATCIKCGQCVQVCPYYALSLLDIWHGSSLGTPYVDARERGCYLCDLYPCVLACPSGALSHETTEIKDVHMGMAYVKRIDACLAFLGEEVKAEAVSRMIHRKLHNDRERAVAERIADSVGNPCSLCADLCPHPSPLEAIAMVQLEGKKRAPQIRSGCVGCGVCQEVCPASESVIEIVPRVGYEELYGGQK